MITKLPNIENAVIEDRKITHYLLNLDNVKGLGKAKFFLSKGFSINDPEKLKMALFLHAHDNPVIKIETDPYGSKYIIEGLANHYVEQNGNTVFVGSGPPELLKKLNILTLEVFGKYC